MTRDQNKFLTLKEEKGGNITFGLNNSTRIVGKCIVSLNDGTTKTQNFLYVEGLKRNILSVIKMCDQGYNLTFNYKVCEIRKAGSRRLLENENKLLTNVYVLDEVKGEKCCMGKLNESWLCHRRMGHIKFDNLVKLSKTQAIKNMSRISKPTDTICKPCQHGKRTRLSFKKKEYSTSNSLELVHTYLWGAARTQTLKGESNFMLLIDDYTRMTWVTFLKEKIEALTSLKL
jgi:hypothetical protein